MASTSVRNGLEKTRDVEAWRPGGWEETSSLKGEQAGTGPDTAHSTVTGGSS